LYIVHFFAEMCSAEIQTVYKLSNSLKFLSKESILFRSTFLLNIKFARVKCRMHISAVIQSQRGPI